MRKKLSSITAFPAKIGDMQAAH